MHGDKNKSPYVLYLCGYGRWPVGRRVVEFQKALVAQQVTRVVDVRLSPCSSNLQPSSNYGPKPWNLQAGGTGIVAAMDTISVRYDWVVELGNPQKSDPAMAVLRGHLAEVGRWPVHRGLDMLEGYVREPGARCCLLCACGDLSDCHQSLVAEALRPRFVGQLAINPLEDPARTDTRRASNKERP